MLLDLFRATLAPPDHDKRIRPAECGGCGLAVRRPRRNNTAISGREGVNLSIAKGVSIGIIGLNGAGKSTLLQMIRARSPSEGTVMVSGRCWRCWIWGRLQ